VSSDNGRPDTVPHTPPAPNLSGFGAKPTQRGGSLTNLVTAGTPSTDTPSAPPTAAPTVAAPTQAAEAMPLTSAEAPATVEISASADAEPEDVPTPKAGTDDALSNLPDLTIDVDDPAALAVTSTVLSVPEPLMRRFEKARTAADTNTAVVLDALRAHLRELPRLVAEARRPTTSNAAAGEPFPWRSSSRSAKGSTATKVRRVQLPIRPLAGELQVIDKLVAWVQQEIGVTSRSLGGKTNRSEVVGAALDAYLPAVRRTR
jgi:hypothetical protein